MMDLRWGLAVGFIVGMTFTLCPCSVAWGHPPASITIAYNDVEKKLHIEVAHVSRNKRDHVIDRLVVYKNDVEANTSKFLKQTSSTKLISDISLEAVPGDVLRVKAFCNDAGSREQTLIVP